MPTIEELKEIEEAATTLNSMIETVEERQKEMEMLHIQTAQLWQNLAEIHQERVEMYYGLLKEAKVEIGSLLMGMDHAEIPHHAVVIHNKLAKIVEITEAEK